MDDGVLLLHGIFRSSRSMRRLERALEEAGYDTLNLDYPARHDGRVSVAATRVAGMADHIVVSATHAFIMSNPAAIRACLDFLQHGRFVQ